MSRIAPPASDSPVGNDPKYSEALQNVDVGGMPVKAYAERAAEPHPP